MLANHDLRKNTLVFGNVCHGLRTTHLHLAGSDFSVHTKAQFVGLGAPLFWKRQYGTAVVAPILLLGVGHVVPADPVHAGEQKSHPVRQNGCRCQTGNDRHTHARAHTYMCVYGHGLSVETPNRQRPAHTHARTHARTHALGVRTARAVRRAATRPLAA